MRQEIAAGIAQGKTDQQILELVAAGHGSDIPVTPMFRGFNTLLWIVPVTVLVVAVGATIAVQVRGRA
jgi:cytochrome c-type biogenesis protein CcmH/NrfF